MKALDSALHKIKKFSREQWVGYLRPDEILALTSAGLQTSYPIEYIRLRKEKGDCRPSWFYFIPGKKLRELLRKKEL